MRRSQLRRVDVEGRRGGCRPRRVRPRRCRRRAPGDSPARRSARESSGTRRSWRPAADRVGASDASVQRASAPQTAMVRADDPAMPAPPATRRAWSTSRSRGDSGARAGRAAADRSPRRARSMIRRDPRPVSIDTSSTPPAGRDAHLRVRTKADGGVHRARPVVEEIQRPDVDGAAREIDAGRRRRGEHGRII